MSQLVETPSRREIAVVQSPIAIFDTARFEHMSRVASMMAECALIPESLQGERKGDVFTPWPPRTIVANCFLVVSYSERLGYDPFLVAQSCSVVRGRLMFEGKLVAAALDDKLGVALSYEFGKWDPKNEVCLVGVEAEDAMSLAVRVWGAHPTTGEIVDVHGSVGVWKPAGDKSPWKPGAYKRQLRYRGAREWARAHQPQIMLGVYTNEEMDDLSEDFRARRAAPVQQPSLSERLGAPAAESSGFSRAHVDRETGDTTERTEEAASTAAATADAKTIHERDVSKVASEAAEQAKGKTLIVAGGNSQARGHSAAAGTAEKVVTEEGEVVKEKLATEASAGNASAEQEDRAEAASQDPSTTNDDPEPPEAKTPEEYAVAVRWRIRHADNAEALVAKWNSATEKNRRNKLGIEPDLRDALKAEVMARANELRAAG